MTQKYHLANVVGNSIHDADAIQQSENIAFKSAFTYFATLQTALDIIAFIQMRHIASNVIKLKWRHSAYRFNIHRAAEVNYMTREQFAFVQRYVTCDLLRST